MEPAIGIGRGDVDVFGRNDENSARRDVGEGVDFFAAADAEGAAAEEEEGNVGANGGGDLD